MTRSPAVIFPFVDGAMVKPYGFCEPLTGSIVEPMTTCRERCLRIDVDAWPCPPTRLFVVEERTVYLRSRSPMTVAHEFAHALDCALGCGVYRSGIDPRVRTLFGNATAFITPYAATGLDEYFAESVRAYVEINDPASSWPRATRRRLLRVDPKMYDYVDTIFRMEFRAAA